MSDAINALDVPEFLHGIRVLNAHDVDIDAMTDDEVRDWLEQYGDLTEFADRYTGYWCTLDIAPMDAFDLPDNNRIITMLSHAEGESDRSDALRNTAKWWQKDIIEALDDEREECGDENGHE